MLIMSVMSYNVYLTKILLTVSLTMDGSNFDIVL